MKQIIRRVAALVVGLGLGAAALAGLESVTHISDLNASWPLGSDLASTSDDHIRNIKSALKTDFPNVNAAVNPTPAQFNQLTSDTFTSAVTGNSFIPSNSAVPTNGLYLPAANSLGWSTNTTARGSINSSGDWTFNAPSSGDTVTINAASTLRALTLNSAASFVSLAFAENGTNKWQIIDNVSVSGKLSFFSGTTSAEQVGITGAGNVTIAAPSSGTTLALTSVSGTGVALSTDGVDATAATGTFTSTYTGFTAGVTCTSTWSRIGKLALLALCAGNGTSNATSFTMTGLPSAIQPATITQNVPLDATVVKNSGNFINTPTGGSATASVTVTAASGTLTFNQITNANGWTASGAKGIFSQTTIMYLLN